MAISLTPLILNQGDSLVIQWFDPLGNSLSCGDCPSPLATPLESTMYGIRVQNEACFDSATIIFDVNRERRVYAPNIFSPNGDGTNDIFGLESPDFGRILALNVYDRWGNLVFQTKNTLFQDPAGWDGLYQNQTMPAGVYVWLASIEFVDGQQQFFSGDVTLVR
jgi:gliding motility-associated-like protein